MPREIDAGFPDRRRRASSMGALRGGDPRRDGPRTGGPLAEDRLSLVPLHRLTLARAATWVVVAGFGIGVFGVVTATAEAGGFQLPSFGHAAAATPEPTFTGLGGLAQ